MQTHQRYEVDRLITDEGRELRLGEKDGLDRLVRVLSAEGRVAHEHLVGEAAKLRLRGG